jgi:hypothetical protein
MKALIFILLEHREVLRCIKPTSQNKNALEAKGIINCLEIISKGFLQFVRIAINVNNCFLAEKIT